jgi:hypothetical protein
MMANSSLIHQFEVYGAWRAALGERIDAYRHWLTENDLGDAQTDLRLQQLVGRLAEERLVVAFVAGFSRGKSELINAIFFADYGRRMLSSSADRSTICPTELLYDRGKPPCIELLPIETRATHASSTEFKRFPEEWRVIPLDTESADAMIGAFAHLGETKRIPVEDAQCYGIFDPVAGDDAAALFEDGTVEIPRWRHAVINFPHPLLEQGLVILDTPEINAIGAKPGLTFSMLPDVHAVLLVLAADTGVTEGDIAIWREQLGQTAGREHFAVLNKIDRLWDGCRTEAQIGAEIAEQRDTCSRLLGLDASRLFPVSAQEGLLAKIDGDDALLARSGLPQLEHALATELIPARHEIMGSLARDEIGNMTSATRSRLEARRRNILDQLQELEYLRSKNRGMIGVMMQKVGVEKESFAREHARYQALRGVLSTHTNRLFTHLGMDALSDDWRHAREEMRRSVFTPGVRSAMTRFFRNVREGLEHSAERVTEISTLMSTMYRKFSDEHGLRLPAPAPAPFSMLKYVKEIDRLEATYERRFNTLVAMLTNEKLTLMQKFFETLASQVKRCYGYANREADQWLRAIMAPMEMQVREHQMQLRRRLESIKRIHQATDTLEDRIEELVAIERGVRAQLEALQEISATLESAFVLREHPLAQAA